MNNYYGYPYSAQSTKVAEVNGMNGANAFQIAPNSSVLLLDNTHPIVYLKQTDGAGYPSIKAFDLVEHKDETQTTLDSIMARLANIERKMGNEQTFEQQQSNEQHKSSNSAGYELVQNERNVTTTNGDARSTK